MPKKPKKSIPNITPTELKILKVLWTLGSGTVRGVKDRLERDLNETNAYTTIMTLMNQLAAKGVLDVDRDRQPFVYTPTIGREIVLRQRVQQFLQQVFDGQASELVLRLVEDAELSSDDIKRIEAKIEAREQAEKGDDGRSGADSADDAEGTA